MSVTNDLITIGFDKNGEADFGISCFIGNLDYKQMQHLRAMIPVAIWQAEDMWRREFEKRQPQAVSAERKQHP